jgi:hypothetical protein
MFDFYYPEVVYNESSLLRDLIVTLIGTFIGFLGAFYLVNISVRKNIGIEKDKKRKENKDILSYFSLLIDSALKSTQKQLDHFEALAQSIKQDPIEINILPIIASTDVKRLQKIDPNKIFISYNELIPDGEDKLKNFKNIYSSIDYISMRIDQAFNSNEKHIGFHHKDQLYIKEKIEELGDVMLNEIKKIENKLPNFQDDPDYKYLISTHQFYLDMFQKEITLTDWEEKFIIPFGKELSKNHSNKLFFYSLFDYVHKTIIRFNHIKYNSAVFSNELFDIRKEMDEPLSVLDQNNGMIKNSLN